MAWATVQGKLGHRQSDILVALRDGTTDTPEAIYSDEGKLHVLNYLWNPDTLAFEVATGGSTSGANVNIKGANTLRYDEGATYTYIGEATAGAAEGSAVWRIKRMTNASLTILYADGDTAFDNVWASRAGLSYS